MEDPTGLTKLMDPELLNKAYDDLLAAAMQEGGKALVDTIKAFRLFTAPLQLLAVAQDRLARYCEKARQLVPEERQVEAPASIALPAMSALRCIEDDNPLTELYVNLLARAIDKERIGEAHPAFVKIIEQLSPDEALIMLQIKEPMEFRGREAPKWLTYPGNFGMYISHLESLNLIVIQGAPDVNLSSPDPSDAYLYRSEVTKFGLLFVKACIPEDFDISISRTSEKTK